MKKNRDLRALIIFFIAITGFIISSQNFLARKGFDTDVLIIGNILLAAISFATFFIYKKALETPNNHVFFRMAYGAFLMKFFIVILFVLIYVLVTVNVNKLSLFACMGLYLIYTFIEIRSLLKINRKNIHA